MMNTFELKHIFGDLGTMAMLHITPEEKLVYAMELLKQTLDLMTCHLMIVDHLGISRFFTDIDEKTKKKLKDITNKSVENNISSNIEILKQYWTIVRLRSDVTIYISKDTPLEYNHLANHMVVFSMFIEHALQLIEHHRAYEKLLGDKELLENILNKIPDMIAVKNLERTFIFANKSANATFADQYTTIVGKNVKEIYPEKNQEFVYALDQETYQNETVTKDFKMKVSKGMIHVESERHVLHNRNQDVIGILSINRDIEDKIEIESKLDKSLSFQDILIKIALEFINVEDEKADESISGALKMIGESIKADRVYVFNYDFDHLVTNNTHEWCAEGIPPEIQNLQNIPLEDIKDFWLTMHQEGKPVIIEKVEDLNHDSQVYQILSMQNIKALLTIPLIHGKKLIGFVGFDIMTELTFWSAEDQKLLQILAELIVNLMINQSKNNELKLEKMHANQANHAKSSFLANMSHEIRTPLSGIYSSVNLLSNTNMDEKQKQYLDIAKISVESLSGIVNDILDLSKIESGKYDVNMTSFCLENELFQIIKMQEFIIREKGLKFEFNFDYGINHEILFDRLLLRQIVLNLLNNAIKFTNFGTIELAASLIQSDDNSYMIRFSITDTGVGISEEALQFITEPFYQADSSASKRHAGTGLGLSIVTQLLKQFDSQLDIYSMINQGTTFSFNLLFSKTEPRFKNHPLIQSHPEMIVLYDEISNVHRNLFESIGFEVTYVSLIDNETIEKNYFDYIIYEARLFDLSIDDTKKHRHQFGKSNAVTIIFDSSSLDAPLSSLAEKQIDYLFPEIITRDKILDTLSLSTQTNQKVSASTLDDYKDKYMNLQVLVVDDNRINRQAIKSILEVSGLTVSTASSGQEAINMIQKNTYKIVFMDIQMPNMDGYETTKIIRELNFSKEKMSIIALTANAQQMVLDKSIQSGMNGKINKPFTMDELFGVIDEQLLAFGRQRKLKIEIPKQLLPFSEKKFTDLFSSKTNVGLKLIEAFIEDYPSDLERLRDAILAKDIKNITKEAHYFKGSASYVSAERVVWLCELIQSESTLENELIMSQIFEKINLEILSWSSCINRWKSKGANQ
jgi:PAS domain S-box-containing protein